MWDVTVPQQLRKKLLKFLLTHPVWDVTRAIWEDYETETFLLTHPVWDVTKYSDFGKYNYRFLLTHPVWDVTGAGVGGLSTAQISTHTSRVGCDSHSVTHYLHRQHFYSHIPCGMWHSFIAYGKLLSISTHTSRVGCDKMLVVVLQTLFISTHTSRVGCDDSLVSGSTTMYDFYSHIPCGMWLFHTYFLFILILFLLTHPVWDVTLYDEHFDPSWIISTHTSRVGCDELHSMKKPKVKFLLTHPVWDVT